jgi:predicted DNA-binding transcriptional regulator YafY
MGDHLLFERYQWFHRQVKAGRHPNAAHLAAQFETSRRTAQRDIDRMADRLRAPLAYDASRKGYVYTEAGFELPLPQISQEELLAILLARNLLSSSAGGLISRAITSFGKKLFLTMGDFGLSEERMSEAFSATWNGYAPAQADVFRQIAEALLQQRLLRFTYHSPLSNEPTHRSVEPHHLQHYNGSWLLIAYSHERKSWRKFALSRISALQRQADTFPLRPRSEWQDQLEGGFGLIQGPQLFTVTLRFTPFRAGWIREQIWHPDQSMTTHPDGSLDLSFPAADLREVKLRVLQFGAEVEVIEPLELREVVREEAARMVRLYGEK